MSQKGFSVIYILVGILIIAGIAGGAYYFGKSQSNKPTAITQSPTPVITFQTPQLTPSPVDETANWKTYTEGNYSVKYPLNYQVKEQKQDGWVQFYMPKTPSSEQDYWQEEFMVWIKDTSETNACNKKVNGYPDAKCIKVNGIDLLNWVHSPQEIGPLAFTYTAIHNGKEYEISFLKVKAEKKDQILSTFKFTN